MNPRVQLLKDLVRDDHYVVDEGAIASAILVRSMARRMLPEVTFRGAPGGAQDLRSFRPDREARSFRLSRRERRTLHTAIG